MTAALLANLPSPILGVFPHPDDEAYSAGGTFALAARQGAAVHILCATRGERGKIRGVIHGSPDATGAIRASELAESCRVLGAQPPRFLGYEDGSLDHVDLAEAAGRIVRVIREVRPAVVITLGPDGVYGHPDHTALNKLVTAAFRAAGGGARFPDADFGAAHQPAQLWWTAFPPGLFRPQWEKLLGGSLAAAVRQVNPERLGVALTDTGVLVDISAVAAIKLAAISCHRSQLPGGDPRTMFPPGIVDQLLTEERFQIGAEASARSAQ